MITVWFSLCLKFSAIALVALAIGVWQGAVAGWVAVCVGLALLHAVHVYQLARLERWLRAPSLDDLPDPWGTWGVVFAGFYRALRREARERDGVVKELDLFKQAAQALPDGVAMLDSGDQLLWCNDTAAGHLGVHAGRDYGLRITNLVRVPRLSAFLQSTRSTPGSETLDYRPAHNPGQLLSLKAIPFSDGRKLLVSFDVTQIERADTTRRDFIANVSHELRTPLTVIHGFLEHMSEAPVMPAEQARRHIGLMVQQSDRMLKLVDDLLMLSRLEGGDNPQREERVDVYALLQGLAEDARALSAGRHQIESIVAENAVITGATDELRSAFGNLVSNAVRYTQQGGRITLAWRIDEKGGGVFSVTDTGIGIAAEHLPRLTERFYRVDRGRSRESGGTGLGLAIVKHVLLRHQATLDIQSEPGAGSEFRITFPAWRSVVDLPARAEHPVADAA